MRRLAVVLTALLALTACEPQDVIRVVWRAQGVPERTVERAVAISWCESGWRPDVVSRTGDHGLMQINWRSHRQWLAGFGITSPEQLHDPALNAYIGFLVWERAGRSFRPWACNRHVR